MAAEDGPVEVARVFFLAQDHSPTRAAQGLMGGRGDDGGMGERMRMNASDHESREVGDVSYQHCVDLGGDFCEGLEVPGPRIG